MRAIMDDNTTTPQGLRRLQTAFLAFAPVVAAAALGNAATLPNIPGWYAGLVKPPLNPPNWVFGPVWTALYLAIAYAFYKILSAPPSQRRRRAIFVFLLQLTLNAGWSFAFFGAHNPFLGLLVVLALEALIGVTIMLFRRINQTAAKLLWPYAVWVAFATYLNAGIWWLN